MYPSLLSNRKKIESKFSDKGLFVVASNSSLVESNPTNSFSFILFFINYSRGVVSTLWPMDHIQPILHFCK